MSPREYGRRIYKAGTAYRLEHYISYTHSLQYLSLANSRISPLRSPRESRGGLSFRVLPWPGSQARQQFALAVFSVYAETGSFSSTAVSTCWSGNLPLQTVHCTLSRPERASKPPHSGQGVEMGRFQEAKLHSG